MDSSRQIKVGAVISYISILINILIGLLFTPWMILKIGKDDYGLYTLAMSVISLFVFDFGLSTAVTRFVAKYLASNRQDKVDTLLNVIYKLYIIGDMIIFILLVGVYFLIPFFYQGLSHEQIEKFRVVFLIAASFSLISFPFIPLNGIFNAYEKYIQLKCSDLLQKIFVVIFTTICLLCGGGLYSLIMVNAISGIAIIVVKLFLLRKFLSFHFNIKNWDKTILHSVIGFSIWITIIAIAQRCIFNIAPSILGMFTNAANIAVLGVAIVIESYVFTFSNAISGMFLPRVSRMVENNSNNDLLLLMIKIGRIQVFIIGFLMVMFLLIGKLFVKLWVGKDFYDVYYISILFIIPAFLFIPQEIGSSAVVALNKVKQQAYVYIIMALINILLAFPLTYFYGIFGLAFSIFVSYIWRVIGMDVIFIKDIHIDIKEFYKKTFLPILLPLGIVLLLGHVVNYFLDFDNEWLEFISKGIIFIVIYWLIISVSVMNQYEKELFFIPIKKIYNKIFCKK